MVLAALIAPCCTHRQSSTFATPARPMRHIYNGARRINFGAQLTCLLFVTINPPATASFSSSGMVGRPQNRMPPKQDTKTDVKPEQVSSLVTNIRDEKEYEDLCQAAVMEDRHLCIKIYATWCRSCKAVAPKFARLAKDPEYSHVEFCALLFDENKALCKKLGIKTLPGIQVIAGSKGRLSPFTAGPSKFDRAVIASLQNHCPTPGRAGAQRIEMSALQYSSSIRLRVQAPESGFESWTTTTGHRTGTGAGTGAGTGGGGDDVFRRATLVWCDYAGGGDCVVSCDDGSQLQVGIHDVRLPRRESAQMFAEGTRVYGLFGDWYAGVVPSEGLAEPTIDGRYPVTLHHNGGRWGAYVSRREMVQADGGTNDFSNGVWKLRKGSPLIVKASAESYACQRRLLQPCGLDWLCRRPCPPSALTRLLSLECLLCVFE